MSRADCIFCEIAEGRRPAHVVASESAVVAFLDTRPLFVGHTLVIPREHHENLVDLATTTVGPFFEAVQRITVAVQSAMAAGGTFVAMNNTVSQSVPHFHVHVVPRNRGDGLRGFFWPRTKYDDDAHAARTAAAIAAKF